MIIVLHKINGSITDHVTITDRDLIGLGPIIDRLPMTVRDGPITDRNAF